MRHVFKATKLGWDKEKEGIWFDADYYTKEEAEAQIKPYLGYTQKGYPYTGYEFDGQQYHDYVYLGKFADNATPSNDIELMEILQKRNKQK